MELLIVVVVAVLFFAGIGQANHEENVKRDIEDDPVTSAGNDVAKVLAMMFLLLGLPFLMAMAFGGVGLAGR